MLCAGIFCAQDRCTALLISAKEGYADCARLLLAAGADKETTDNVQPCF
jgi:hypothetical protein